MLNTNIPQEEGGQSMQGSPIEQGSVPVQNNEGELSQEQMRANLQELAGKIEEKYQDFNSQSFASKNKIEMQRRDALKEVFNIMSDAGIDLGNPEDVRAFLDSLKERNPELYSITEASLEEIFKVEEPEATPQEGNIPVEAEEPLNNMNINQDENIPQNF